PLPLAAALVVIYLILVILYESIVHPVTNHLDPAVGGPRGAVAADGGPHGSERDRDRGHPLADRHRQEERHHAGRFRAGSGTQPRLDGRRGDLPGIPAAESADPDDHHRRARSRGANDGRYRDWIGNPPAARLRSRWRAGASAGT